MTKKKATGGAAHPLAKIGNRAAMNRADDASHLQSAEIFVDGGSTGSPGRRGVYFTYAAWRLVAACNALANAFSRCSGPTWVPSAEINSGLATPMKPNTQRK